MGSKLLFFCCIILLISMNACKKASYFPGEITVFSDFEKEIRLKGEKIKLDDVYTGTIYAYDTLLFLSSDNYPDQKLLHIFGLHSKKELGSFCSQGRGPHEYIDFSCFGEFQKENDDLKLWIGDILKGKIQLLNLTQSLKKKDIQIDKFLYLNWQKKWQTPIVPFFMPDSNLCLYKNSNEYLYKNKGKYDVGQYHLCRDSIDNELKNYPLYNQPIQNHDPNIEARYLLCSSDRIKPDKSKVVMAMERLIQINILDIKTGEIKGYRKKESPDFENLKDKFKNIKYFYINAEVDDDYIYALNLNCPADQFPVESNQIHVYDWNGKPICEITTDQKFFSIAVDPVNGLVYGKNFMEEIYCYDVRSALKNKKQ